MTSTLHHSSKSKSPLATSLSSSWKFRWCLAKRCDSGAKVLGGVVGIDSRCGASPFGGRVVASSDVGVSCRVSTFLSIDIDSLALILLPAPPKGFRRSRFLFCSSAAPSATVALLHHSVATEVNVSDAFFRICDSQGQGFSI